MLKIAKLCVQHRSDLCVTDEPPRFSFALESDKSAARLVCAEFRMGDWEKRTSEQCAIYDGPALAPRTRYAVHVRAADNHGETAEATIDFETGKLGEVWKGKWISHPTYRLRERKVSPCPMRFRREFRSRGEILSAKLYCSAVGIYICTLNGVRVGEDYFSPGFTSYHHQMQYQTYDVTSFLGQENELCATVAGGWAVGSYTYARRNRIYARRQAFLAELYITYADGTQEIIATDESWQATMDGPLKAADIYDGEIYDAAEADNARWESAAVEELSFTPWLIAQYGAPVRVYERRKPLSCTRAPSGALIYDFGQNFAGIVQFTVKGEPGQEIVLSHAEILMNGELFREPLRTAKQQIVYRCGGGTETYAPQFTYMGFRYVGVTGIEAENIELTALGLCSDLPETGSFACSDERLNKLQSNIRYGARSNFVDIPTDCPQRDERLGWTGDIALFASTAAYNFDMSRFFEKWLRDVRSEQGKGGGLPMVVPTVKIYSQWEMCIAHAVDHWGDACILVPWAEYLARGDLEILRANYAMMQKYLEACQFWAGLFSRGEKKYIWKLLHHYGDWCAPDADFGGWMRRGQWTATACMANSAKLLSQIAELLGASEDATRYRECFQKTAAAYRSVFMDDDLRLKKEFQTAYVLPLYYSLFSKEDAVKMAAHLARLVRRDGICTGFPGTPYLLFALADNGQTETAFETLLSEQCPSWLYEVKAGGTTLWERWDALREDGTCNQGSGSGMVSFNHYAPGAVGDFLYRRVAGIESTAGGYRTFRIAPVLGGGITWAKASVETAYGTVSSEWKLEDGHFRIHVSVPVGTACELVLPNEESQTLESGSHHFTCNVQ